MEPEPRVFISYARRDGEAFASHLRQRLEKENIPLWQDRVNMEGGRDWWLQIVEALDKVEYLVLVMTPGAIESDTTRKEWRYARQKGVCVYPVKGVPDAEIDYNSLPRWMRTAHFYDLDHEWKPFINGLNSPCKTPRVPFMVEDLPIEFVERPREFEELVNHLRDPKREEPLAITAALRGAGGYGKTILARAICHDERILEAFDDGILWVTLGENPTNLIGKLEDLIYTLSGEQYRFSDIKTATARLTELLADRDILMVIDDVWNRAHLAPFLQGGERCARLITTRNSDTLPANVVRMNLDAMQQSEALQLLSFGLPTGGQIELMSLAKRLGEWPLLLRIVNGVLRQRAQSRQTIWEAITYVNQALDKRGLTAFDPQNPIERNQATTATVNVSLDLLTDAEKQRFAELAIFPEDVDITLETIGRLWQRKGLDIFDTEELCARFFSLSLLWEFRLDTRTFRLHDVMRKMMRQQNIAVISEINRDFLSSYELRYWPNLPKDESYLWKYLTYHLMQANQSNILHDLLLDYHWMDNKLRIKGINELISDYEFIRDEPLTLVKGALSLSAHILLRNPEELASQLFGRLNSKFPDIKMLLIQVATEKNDCWLKPMCATLILPGGPLLRTMEGSYSLLRSVAVTPDGKKVVSGSDDDTLKVWDLESGAELHELKGHDYIVSSVAVTPDGKKIVSGSRDNTLRVWDLENGAQLLELKGHSGDVNSVAVTPDGKKVISGSDDTTLRVWDLESGAELLELKGHRGGVITHKRLMGFCYSDVENRGYVNSVTVTPDGKKVVSGSDDDTLKVWDLASGVELLELKGHSDQVNSVTVTPDGKKVVSGSDDNTLKVWDLASGAELLELKSHNSAVMSVAVTPDGKKIVSGSDDNTLKVWDLASGAELLELKGHNSTVISVAVTPDGKKIISSSYDNTLKVWDMERRSELFKLKGHNNSVMSVAVTPDGKKAVSCSLDNFLKVWEPECGAELLQLEVQLTCPSSWISSVAITADGKKAVSATSDNILKVWDIEHGSKLLELKGHISWVNSVAITADGKKAVSASRDMTLKVWDLESGAELLELKGHSDCVNSVAVTADGKKAVSASDDDTLKVWDLESGVELLEITSSDRGLINSIAVTADGKKAVSIYRNDTLKAWDLKNRVELVELKGHSDIINSLALTPDGKKVVSASRDMTLKVWNLESRRILASITGESPIKCCTISSDGRTIIAGEETGRMHFLHLEGVD